jgi:hypothetical protein
MSKHPALGPENSEPIGFGNRFLLITLGITRDYLDTGSKPHQIADWNIPYSHDKIWYVSYSGTELQATENQ